MDFSYFDKAEDKVNSLANYIKGLKEENREFARNVYSLEIDLKKKLPSEEDLIALKEKHSGLIEERDRLMMEREFLRKKIEAMINRLDEVLAQENSGG